MVPADPDTRRSRRPPIPTPRPDRRRRSVAAFPDGRPAGGCRSCRSRSRSSRSWPGRRPVHVGLLDGPPGRRRSPGRRSRRTRPSSRSGTRTTRSTSATPAATSTATRSIQGAIRGHDRRARRPVLRLPHLGGVPREPAGHQRPVRGHRRRDRDARRRTGRRAARTLGSDCRLVDHRADRRLAGREGRAAWPGDVVLAGRRRAARRPDGRCARGTGSAGRRARS